ncbi:MAG: hypothetical protein KGJ11_00075 [Candidatus Omnitrophica bacterium]|nr:hypothetical protein [Candidatus Omnitrophota bacterium]
MWDGMIKVEELKHLLELKESEVAKLDKEQLRLLLGVLRYSTRIIQRELNAREELVSTHVKPS